MFTTYIALATLANLIPLSEALPSIIQRQSSWPPLDQVPDTNSPEVRQWVSQIDWSKVPNISPSGSALCDRTSNQNNVANAQANCWWSCNLCTRPDDATACPNRGEWGLTFDDGPSQYTNQLLDYLDSQRVKATFFLTGSQSTKVRDTAIRLANTGHQIGVHTWSHTALTTLTNEQVVAELGWTREVLNQITNRNLKLGLMRPPFGDIDDRVRAISHQMGLIPTIWTAGPYDTKDYTLVDNPGNQAALDANLNDLVTQGRNRGNGFITLQHDIEQPTVTYAINTVIPRALKEGFALKALYQCGIA
ncbi:glycoside hydrolase/deacetylase [Pseudovirgaria hyperparasitica]|uniref:chitin deacetylase n=1 Tax=Pseudovirgaria hyperparasitica TaxID=470096 RepID=A0A6A6WCS2_9PEZI|nr:glycoside hydrolase/deacetylase [Pseudovirgaria hyperparasitica]KAF2760503.1 glycoside hydrolase/deacetylase [Pseudovirgaria hyperparasitica]